MLPSMFFTVKLKSGDVIYNERLLCSDAYTRGYFAMSPRLTDWSLALAALLALLTGLISLVSGHLGDWFIFALHGAAGLWLLLLLWGKLRRVWPRLVRLRRWDRRTGLGLLALLAVVLTLGAGIWWVAGGQ